MNSYCYPETIEWSDQIDLDPEAMERSEMLAWTSLETLTGLKLTNCPVVVRPCSRACWKSAGSYYESPVTGADWRWINAAARFGRASSTELYLPGPVARIDGIVIDGVPMPATDYHLDGNTLVRTDGGAWPACQDMDAAPGEPNTFTVTYVQGALPDALLNHAAGILAREFVLAMTADRACRLPSNVRSVTRQGISYELAIGTFADGVTGIAEVDIIVRRHNPHGLNAAPIIASPDTLRRAR